MQKSSKKWNCFVDAGKVIKDGDRITVAEYTSQGTTDAANGI